MDLETANVPLVLSTLHACTLARCRSTKRYRIENIFSSLNENIQHKKSNRWCSLFIRINKFLCNIFVASISMLRFCCLFIFKYNCLLCLAGHHWFCVEWKTYTKCSMFTSRNKKWFKMILVVFLIRLLSLKWPSIQISSYSQCRHRNVSDHIYKVKSHTHIHIFKLIVSA